VINSIGWKFASLVLVAVPLALLAACGDDDSGSVSGSASGSASGVGIEPGVVQAKPADATQVEVVLREWEVAPRQSSVKAGKVYFLVENAGPEDPHEFVVIKSDLAPGSLPFEDDVVPEDKVDIIDEIEPFAPKSKASLVLTLEKGKYVLICNITEEEDGEIESHYREGMRTAFTVE
jgi:uncharacterized cupredoxin-like copper-binding protein